MRLPALLLVALSASFSFAHGAGAETKSNAGAFPVLARGATVLFIGDSITDGGRARKGNDYNHTMGQGFPFIVAAQLSLQLAERDVTFVNRGISGNRILDLRDRWQTDVIESKPDVLSILVGVNDTFWSKGERFEDFEPVYDELLARTLEALPHVRIILCEPFLLPSGSFKADYEARRSELAKRQEAIARLAAKYQLPLIRYQRVFNKACERAPAEHWCWDGVHPHYAGHALIAEEWIKTASSLR